MVWFPCLAFLATGAVTKDGNGLLIRTDNFSQLFRVELGEGPEEGLRGSSTGVRPLTLALSHTKGEGT
jgi:hypothetical protein